MKAFFAIAFFLFTCNLVGGLRSVQFSPPVNETIVVSNFTGLLQSVDFSTSDGPQLFQWQVSTNRTVLSKNFSSEKCRNESIVFSGFSTRCNLQQWSSTMTITAVEPINNPFNLSFALKGPGFDLSFSKEIKVVGCEIKRANSRPISKSDITRCKYNCTVTYECISGYKTLTGNTYTARCNKRGDMEPLELCKYDEKNDYITQRNFVGVLFAVLMIVICITITFNNGQ